MSKMKMLNSPALLQFVLYALCGGSGVALDFVLFSLLVHAGFWYQFANLAGYVGGTLLSFVLNRAFTFKVFDRPLLRLAVFCGVAFTGYLVSTAMLWWMIEGLLLHPILAKLLTLGVVLVLQFSLNRLITFKSAQASA